MRFWRIQHPDYKSDYQHSYINGSIENPHSLKFPAVDCDVCVSTRREGWKWLPFVCPESLRGVIEPLSSASLPLAEHKALQKELFAALGQEGEPFIDLAPGANFEPCCLDIPSRPRADFLWPGLGTFLVSERIRNVLLASCGDEVGATEVVLRKVGKRNAALPAPIPQTGEPEDIINEASVLVDKTEIGPYYHIVPRKESAYPPNRVTRSICPGCQRVEMIYPKNEHKPRMTNAMWKGHRIFYLGSTLRIIVTDEVKQLLMHLRPTNVIFAEAD